MAKDRHDGAGDRDAHQGKQRKPPRPAPDFVYKGDNPLTEEIRRVYLELVAAKSRCIEISRSEESRSVESRSVSVHDEEHDAMCAARSEDMP